MKIYFSAAQTQLDKFSQYYRRIVERLEDEGHRVLQDTTRTPLPVAVSQTGKQRVASYNQVLHWISESDVVVLEVSFPSTLHIGHELTLALEKGRPVVALYLEGYEPSFFMGMKHTKVFWSEYTDDDLGETVAEGLAQARGQLDTRFNFFLSPKHIAYLEKRSKATNMPRAAYVRKLLEDDMERN